VESAKLPGGGFGVSVAFYPSCRAFAYDTAIPVLMLLATPCVWARSAGREPDVCPSVSWDHPDHTTRRANGNPTLPLFNVYGADLETIQFCCTSGHCEGCRDSQAVQTWLLVSVRHFLQSTQGLQTWVELAENYWRQFVWSPYHAVPGVGRRLRAARAPNLRLPSQRLVG